MAGGGKLTARRVRYMRTLIVVAVFKAEINDCFWPWRITTEDAESTEKAVRF
jgi:hypothetical protein